MSENRFKNLLDLVAFDQQIRSAEKRYEALEHALLVCQQEKDAIYQQQKSVMQQVHNMRKEVDLLELEMKTLDAREMQKKKQLDNAHSVKEYNSSKIELEAMRREQETIEQELILMWNKLEQAQQAERVYTNGIDNLLALADDKLRTLTQEKQELAHTLSTYIEQRPEYEKKVVPEWLEKYTMMRARVDNPVVPITDTECSVCFNHATAQDAMRIGRGALLQCKGCYRLLYSTELLERQ